jgi:hypothetical protein
VNGTYGTPWQVIRFPRKFENGEAQAGCVRINERQRRVERRAGRRAYYGY